MPFLLCIGLTISGLKLRLGSGDRAIGQLRSIQVRHTTSVATCRNPME
jgi:hypothetical protein